MKSSAIIASIGAASAKWGLGSCPKVNYMEAIDMERYAGHWFEVYRDEHNWYTQYADCVTKEFELNQNGNLDLYFRGFYNWHGWGKYSGVGGEISDCGTSSGLLQSSTCMATMGGSPRKLPFDMLATDYDNYDIGYFCKDFYGFFHADNLAITSRTQEMSDEVQQEVRAVIAEKLPHYNLNDGMYWTKQGDDKCQYYWMDEHEGQAPPYTPWW